jgi:hypothetical protein
MRKHTIIVLVSALTGGMWSEGFGQVTLTSFVIASGGVTMSGGTYSSTGTTGQGLIGSSSGVTYSVNGGFWGGSGTILDVETEKTGEMPGSFALYQNFPNPFNPNTVIRFELPMTAFVSLRVYDRIGREVSSLVNELKEVGTYEVRFGGMNLASGVYVYRLQAGEYVQSKRFVLLK